MYLQKLKTCQWNHIICPSSMSHYFPDSLYNMDGRIESIYRSIYSLKFQITVVPTCSLLQSLVKKISWMHSTTMNNKKNNIMEVSSRN